MELSDRILMELSDRIDKSRVMTKTCDTGTVTGNRVKKWSPNKYLEGRTLQTITQRIGC